MDPASRLESGQGGVAEERRAKLRRARPQVRIAVVRGAGHRVVLGHQTEASDVPRAEVVADLEHHVQRDRVPARGEGPVEIHQPAPQIVPDHRAHRAWVEQKMGERFVARARPGDPRVHVDADQIAPYRGMGLPGGRRQLDHQDGVAAELARLCGEPVDRVAGGRTTRLVVHGEAERTGTATQGFLVVAVVVPEPGGPLQPADPVPARVVVDLLDQRPGLDRPSSQMSPWPGSASGRSSIARLSPE